MEIKLGQLVQAEEVLNTIGKQSVSIKTAYHLAKLMKLVKEETSIYHLKREEFIKELGEKREPTKEELAKGVNGEIFEVAKDKIPEFVKQINELSEISVTIDKWLLLTLELLENIDISAQDVLFLDSLIIEKE